MSGHGFGEPHSPSVAQRFVTASACAFVIDFEMLGQQLHSQPTFSTQSASAEHVAGSAVRSIVTRSAIMRPVYRASLLCLAMLSACANRSFLLSNFKECESFTETDAAVRAELDQLLTSAPGDVLWKESARLNSGRRECARHQMLVLRDLRESDGIQAVQRELDALTRTYEPEELDRIVVDALGPESAQLKPLLAEARQRVAREKATPGSEKRDDEAMKGLAVDGPSRVGPEPTGPETMCDAPTPCEQLACVANEGADVTRPARACFDSLDRNDPAKEAKGLAKILALLPPGISGTRTEVQLRLEAVRVGQWQKLDREVKAGHSALAAEIATPFAVLDNYRAEVERLRAQAQSHHLVRARALASTVDAAWLHAQLSAVFGGTTVEATPLSGKWQSVRWRCEGEQPALPAPPAGISGTLSVRCETKKPSAPNQKAKPPGATPVGSEADDIMSTFELEKSMRAQGVMASLSVQCADKTSLFTVNADDVESVPRELTRSYEQIVAACVNMHALAATKSCTEIRRKTAAEITARFVDHARFNQKWEPCFVEWLAAEEGASPPAPPPFPLAR